MAIGDTVSECEESYLKLLYTNGIKETAEDTREVLSITGRIEKIAQSVIDGNSHYYLMVEGSDAIFDVPVADYIDIIRYDAGQEITLEYKEGDETNIVLSVKEVK